MATIFNIFDIAGEEDASSLTLGLRLCDISTNLALAYAFVVHAELAVLRRKHPSQWEEVVLFGKLGTHSHQVEPEQVLASNNVDSWIVVDLLVEVHADEDVRFDREVRPEDVPVSGFRVCLDAPAQLFGHLADHWVLRHCVSAGLLETLIVMRFRLVLSFRMRSIFGRFRSILVFSY